MVHCWKRGRASGRTGHYPSWSQCVQFSIHFYVDGQTKMHEMTGRWSAGQSEVKYLTVVTPSLTLEYKSSTLVVILCRYISFLLKIWSIQDPSDISISTASPSTVGLWKMEHFHCDGNGGGGGSWDSSSYKGMGSSCPKRGQGKWWAPVNLED